MNTLELFNKKLQVLIEIQPEKMRDILLCHGIIHVFAETFDAGQLALRDYFMRHQLEEEAKGTPKELVMDAYERILEVSEDTWIQMLCDRYHPDISENVLQRAQRILNE